MEQINKFNELKKDDWVRLCDNLKPKSNVTKNSITVVKGIDNYLLTLKQRYYLKTNKLTTIKFLDARMIDNRATVMLKENNDGSITMLNFPEMPYRKPDQTQFTIYKLSEKEKQYLINEETINQIEKNNL